jgi:hypothetical protein
VGGAAMESQPKAIVLLSLYILVGAAIWLEKWLIFHVHFMRLQFVNFEL